MDQAPVQDIDVARSLETTLSTLAHILQPRIKVQRAYEPVPLLVNTLGTELNQVWANIIENSVDAMLGEGEQARNVGLAWRPRAAIPFPIAKR